MAPARVWTPVDDGRQLKDARLRQLLAHWSGAARHGQLPPKDIVEPEKLGELMEWLFLYRVDRNPLRFFYLMCGSGMVRRLGIDMTGKYLDEHPDPQVRDAITANFTAVLTTGKPHYRAAPRRVLGHEVTTEALVLPLGGPDGAIDHLLALQVIGIPQQ